MKTIRRIGWENSHDNSGWTYATVSQNSILKTVADCKQIKVAEPCSTLLPEVVNGWKIGRHGQIEHKAKTTKASAEGLGRVGRFNKR